MICKTCGHIYENGPILTNSFCTYKLSYKKEHYRVINSIGDIVDEYDEDIISGIESCPLCIDRNIQ